MATARCPDCGEPRTLRHLLGECAAFPVAWELVFDGRSPGWLLYREPHLTVEYLCARGWTEEPRHHLLSTSYVKARPAPPVAGDYVAAAGSDSPDSSESADGAVLAVALV